MTARSLVGTLPLAALLALAACGTPDSAGARPVADGESAAAAAADVVLPPRNAEFDYQIGGGYTPPQGAEAVIRDREDTPAEGVYNVCYVNGFQVQPQELDWWQENHPDLLLRDAGGDLVIDPNWDEALIDISTAGKREEAAGVVGDWMAGCADSGFDAVELDNLDAWTRAEPHLTQRNAVAFAELLTERAHAEGLAAAQKNAAKLIRDGGGGPVAGFDFAVTEECGRWNECGVFEGAYPGRVLDIEYREADMDAACSYTDAGVSVVLRDVDVRPKGHPDHVHGTCAGAAG